MSAQRTMKEYTELLKINKHDLDGCIEQQAVLFNEIAVALANAVSVRDNLKKDYEEMQAEVAADLRQEALQDGKKMTDKAVTEAVGEDKHVKQAYKDFLDSKQQVDLWTALKESYLQRSYMIKELAQLYIAGYFADQTFIATEVVVEELKVEESRRASASKRRPLKRRES